MKQSLPWSVTGIPPEAREAARAAASREGLSVGDWLTRRIMGEAARSLGDMPDPEPPPDLPQPGARRYYRDEETRRDGDALIARIARAEAETDFAFRRIDETLRAMTRRLEDSERSQNEASRAMGAAAADINQAAREQANALSTLAERIDRVEHNADGGSMRDAVRGLHQGLSRLADQIARTATESSTQVSSLAANVEALAGKLAATREESGKVAHTFEARVAQLADRVKTAEESSDGATKALRTALGLFESRFAAAEPKAEETARQSQAISNLEKSVEEIAQRVTGTESHAHAAEEKIQQELGRQLSAIEQTLDTIVRRLEMGEKESRDALSDLRTRVGETATRIDALSKPADPYERSAAPILDLPPLTEAPPPSPYAQAAPAQPSAEPPPAFAPRAAEPSPPIGDAAPPPLEPTTFAEPPRPQAPAYDYLAAARRAAQAAAEAEVEAAPRQTLGGFRVAEPERKSHFARTALIGAIVLLVLVAALAGILFTRGVGPGELVSDRMDEVGEMFTQESAPAPAPSPQNAAPAAGLPARPLTREDASPYLGPSAAYPEDSVIEEPAPDVEAPPAASAVSPPPAGLPARPATRLGEASARAEPQTLASLPPAQVPTLEPLKAKAVAGNAPAALVLGLKYLDGDGVTQDDAEAYRWISKAAQQGNAVAQYRAGTLYERGRGVPADAKKAHEWYMKAARQGNRKAMHNLAVSFAQGTGTEKNFAEAARWFGAAAELGLLDSQFNLAVLYERGLGVPPSLRDAYKWYVIAAAQGDAESKTRLEALATQLSPADKQEADKAAQSFRARPMNRAANDVPALAQMQ
ncbi:MAG: hypothetical protein ACT4OG_07640 [Alphaproteobacteria bacterium]